LGYIKNMMFKPRALRHALGFVISPHSGLTKLQWMSDRHWSPNAPVIVANKQARKKSCNGLRSGQAAAEHFRLLLSTFGPATPFSIGAPL
jgi:hypothetical protein